MRELKTDLAYLKTKTVEALVIQAKKNTPPTPRGIVECFGECKITTMDSLVEFGQKAKKMKPLSEGEAKLEHYIKSLPNTKERIEFLSDLYLELQEESRVHKTATPYRIRKKMEQEAARRRAERRGEEYVDPHPKTKFNLLTPTQEELEQGLKRTPTSLVGKFFLGVPNYKRLRFYIAALYFLCFGPSLSDLAYFGPSLSDLIWGGVTGFFASPYVMTVMIISIGIMRNFAHTNKVMLWLCKNLRFVANKMFDVVEGIVSGIYKTFGGDTSKVEDAFERAKIAFMG